MTQSSIDPTPNYVPPSSSAIASTQDTTPALRLLLAQRTLYTHAKRWGSLRMIGVSVIAVAAPLVTAASPDSAVVVGAVASGWIFLSRTLFVGLERKGCSKGAEVQEQFDTMVFGMPQLALRDPRATPEDISALIGTDAEALAAAKKENLLGWYPIDTAIDGTHTVAIAQRANAAYSERLLNSNANMWLGITMLWAAIAIIVGVALSLSFWQFMLGVLLPLMPALLDVYEQWRVTKSAGKERRAIADGIETRVRGGSGEQVSGEDLLVWQDQLYGLRRNAPQVPNIVYKRKRKMNELAMNAAATELAKVVKTRSSQGDS